MTTSFTPLQAGDILLPNRIVMSPPNPRAGRVYTHSQRHDGALLLPTRLKRAHHDGMHHGRFFWPLDFSPS